MVGNEPNLVALVRESLEAGHEVSPVKNSPKLSATGLGSDIMVPMAIPSFGGMLVAILTIFIVPCIYRRIEEAKPGKSGPEA